MTMRLLALTALFALGLGLAGLPAANAAPAAGIGQAAVNATLIEQAAYACRRIKVCKMTVAGRRCAWERVCKVW
jgi:hypothetical protein